MTWYFDLTQLKRCTGILVDPRHQVIFTGTRIHTEDESVRDCEQALRLERELDLHFWFGPMPPIGLYTVPKCELGGYDSCGGFFVGCPDFIPLEGARMYYIDREKRCWCLPEGLVSGWRERLVPEREIRIFDSFEEAAKAYPILRPENEKQLLEMLMQMEEA